MNVRIFTDGACSSNPGSGGCAAIMTLTSSVKTFSAFEENTTNNRMELKAVIIGITGFLNMVFQEEIKEKENNLEIISDSAYVINSINLGWLKNWKKNGFKSTDNKDIKNIDLWKTLDEQFEIMDFLGIPIKFTKVKGHNGNYFNEMADRIAKQEISKNMKK